MSNPTYKLTYFNARGRAEHIRFIFAHAGVDFVDERIKKEEWLEMKKRVPFGMVPVLEVDGAVISQSNAIARHLAQKFDLVGTTAWETAQCDELVDTLSDLKQALMQYRAEVDPFKKEERKTTLLRDTIPFYLNKFENVVKGNNGFSVGSKITWADFVFATSLESFETIFGKDSLEKYPALKGLKNMVFNLPKIQEWVEKRPTTEF